MKSDLLDNKDIEDINDIIRYPMSRRTFYMKQPNGILAIYHNPCGPIQASVFHRNSMLFRGWKIAQHAVSISKAKASKVSKASASICFYKEDRRCIVNVSPYEYGSHTLIIYHEDNRQ